MSWYKSKACVELQKEYKETLDDAVWEKMSRGCKFDAALRDPCIGYRHKYYLADMDDAKAPMPLACKAHAFGKVLQSLRNEPKKFYFLKTNSDGTVDQRSVSHVDGDYVFSRKVGDFSTVFRDRKDNIDFMTEDDMKMEVNDRMQKQAAQQQAARQQAARQQAAQRSGPLSPKDYIQYKRNNYYYVCGVVQSVQGDTVVSKPFDSDKNMQEPRQDKRADVVVILRAAASILLNRQKNLEMAREPADRFVAAYFSGSRFRIPDGRVGTFYGNRSPDDTKIILNVQGADEEFAPDDLVATPDDATASAPELGAEIDDGTTKMDKRKALHVLGLFPGATSHQITGAYKTLARKHHPDKRGDPETFKTLQSAYDALKGGRRKSRRKNRLRRTQKY